MFINNQNLGRYWKIGPQQTLYLPGCWLKKGENEVIVMDIVGPTSPSMSGLRTPVIDQLRRDLLPHDAVKEETAKPHDKKAKQTGGAGNDAAPGAK